MKKYIGVLITVFGMFLYGSFVFAQDIGAPINSFYRGEIITVEQEQQQEGDETALHMKVRIMGGPEHQNVITPESYIIKSNNVDQFSVGQEVVVMKTELESDAQYYITDHYRLPSLIIIFVLFFVLIIIFAGKRGITSLAGLGFSILILTLYIVPSIFEGKNPLLVSITGAVIIAVISLYLAHGFNRRTSIALIATLATIAIAFVFDIVFVHLAQLFGLGSEEAYYLQNLQVGVSDNINLRGLLLGGIIIGVLGVLDDVTTAQVATVDELKKANNEFGFKELYTRGISVGREHITSLVNTLVLAYAGASMPLLLLLTLNHQPLWVTMNSQFMAEEIIRTLVGSSTLVLCVPLTTLIAAYIIGKKK